MLAMSPDLGLSYQPAFGLRHKIREAIAAKLKGHYLGGDSKRGSRWPISVAM